MATEKPNQYEVLSGPELLLIAQNRSDDTSARNEIVRRLGGIEPIAGYQKKGGLLLKLANNVAYKIGFGGQKDLIQDIISETYCQLFDPAIARYNRGKGGVVGYLWGLVHNSAKKVFRPYLCQQANTTSCSIDQSDCGISIEHIDNRTPESVIVEKERDTAIDNILDSTEAHLSEAIRMRFFNDIPWSRIAQKLQVDRTTLARQTDRLFQNIKYDLEYNFN